MHEDGGLTDVLYLWRTAMRAANCTPATIRTRTGAVGSLRRAGYDPIGASTHDLREWLGRYSGWTTCTYVSAARAWYGWLVAEGIRGDDPTVNLARPRQPRRTPRPVSAADLEAALLASVGHVHAYVTLGAYAGLRCSEIARMRGEHVTPAAMLVRGKGGREDYLPTHPRVWLLAQTYPRRGWWFPSWSDERRHVNPNSVSKALSRLFDDLDVRATGHMLRHTFVSRAYRASGRDLLTTQRLARHESPSTTAGYAQVEDVLARAAVLALDERT